MSSDQEKREALKALKEKLDRTERTTGRSGAIESTPKQKMFDISGIKEKNPNKHYRYVNTSDAAKAQLRVEQGYVAVPEEECREAGVRPSVGEGRLMELPRERAEERREEIREMGERRLKASRTEVRQAAEAVARELRDKHGIDLPLERLLVDE
jgi:hypothetical protein